MQKFVIFVKKNLKINIWKTKNVGKLESIAIIQENIEVLRIAYVIWKLMHLKNNGKLFEQLKFSIKKAIKGTLMQISKSLYML